MHMRMTGVLVVATVAMLLAGCGEQSDPSAPDDRSGVTGHVTLGPQCPVEIEGRPCDDKPAAGVEVTIGHQLPGDAYAMGDVVTRATTDAQGDYRAAVPPGDYVVTADAGMSCELMDVRVTEDEYVRMDIPCDTGIR